MTALPTTAATASTAPGASSADLTIAEVENLVEPGEIDPDEMHLPGIYVQRVVALTPEQAADKQIERTTTRPRTSQEA